jgi:putative FmdB family regulatory protein
MPTYAYACEKCGHEFEKFQSMKDPVLKVCPEDLCRRKQWGRGRVRRLLGTGAGLIFKGSGFYITDYRSESYKAAAKAEKSSGAGKAAAGGDKASSSAKSETKSAKSKGD